MDLRSTLPAALLTIVATVQIALTMAAGLTPWKGGGFGMFSSLDHGAFRGVDIVVDAPDRSETLDMPVSLERLAARAANFPSSWLLRSLAEAVAAREARQGREIDRVTLTVWRTSFSPATFAAHEATLRRFVYDVP